MTAFLAFFLLPLLSAITVQDNEAVGMDQMPDD